MTSAGKSPTGQFKRRRLPKIVSLWVLVIFCGCGGKSSAPSSSEQPLILSGPTMGTYFRVTIASQPASVSENELRKIVESNLEEVNSLMSTYQADSELSQFNKYAQTDWFSVSLDTATVVSESLKIYGLSKGVFDVTVGPLVNLWGFGPTGKRDEPPAPEEIDKALEKIGFRHLQVRLSPPALKKDAADLYVDLSGIAKGYAVDKVAESLEALGIHDFIVDIGGDLLTRGHKKNGDLWKIAIESPTVDGRNIQRAISASDLAIATSGDYRNYFEINGKRFSHEIDPRTGRPITHSLASVSVLGPSCMRADAWATALIVLGPIEGFRIAENEGLDAYFIIKDKDGFREKETTGFKRMSNSHN